LQHEAQVQSLEQEHLVAIQQLRGELDSKNNLEREMHGQIERLGKTLEQSAEDLQRLQDEALENDERLRNELAEERRARSEERAEMAARQKELKQQLAEVAGKHEGVLASQADILEQAREEARREERTRLRHELEQQGHSNEQVTALQAELEQLREQATLSLEQERERSSSDLDVAREQRAHAKAEIVGLKTQLKQLTQERDEALSSRQALEKQISTLRNKSATASQPAGPGEGHEDADTTQLREELEDARMNIEIAVRLHTEAEAELEQVTEHRDRLLQQLEKIDPAEAMTAAPAPEDNGKQVAARQQASAGSGGKAEFKYVVDDANGGKRRWLGAMVGLGVAGIAGLVFWLMLSMEDPMAKFLDLVNMDKARAAWSEFRLPQWPDSAAKQGDDAAMQEIKPVPSAAVEARPAASSAVAKAPAQTADKAAQPPVAELPKARRSFRDALGGGGRGPLMLELPAGSYLMGSAGNSMIFEERPQHRVELASFSIGKYEVSFAEYGRFARATGRRLPHDEKWGRDDRPVINVTWNDARAYTRWLSKQTGHQYRLPNEAEWEYAARAGTTTDYWWDPAANTAMANCFNCGSEWDGNSSAPVGSFPANSLGLHDTAGNVQEWTEDCYHPSYQGAPADGSARQRPGCTQRVTRGGGYTSPVDSLRSNKRGYYNQDTRIDNLGFRVVRVK
jgi:formylglycine-generating enzyme required for sulfatase activity